VSRHATGMFGRGQRRYLIITLAILLGPVFSAEAQISVNIGIRVSAYPDLVLVPGYPVYYDPRGSLNFFFYDGLYWVYEGDNWYSSSWYDGPWQLVDPEDVPLFVLRVPVRYYRRPPAYFSGWGADAPPHWGEHWGSGWQVRRSGWDRWDAHSAPTPAPLPSYQQQYSGNRYPRDVAQQRTIQAQGYQYQPHEPVAPQHLQPSGDQGSLRAPPQNRAPVEQRTTPQNPRLPLNVQPQQSQTREQLPVQPARPTQPHQQPPPTQHSQPTTQDRGPSKSAEQHDQARVSRSASKEQDQKTQPAPHENGRDKQEERGAGQR